MGISITNTSAANDAAEMEVMIMKADIKANRGRVSTKNPGNDTRTHVEKLTIEATRPGDAQLLAAIATALFPITPKHVDQDFKAWATARVSALFNELKARRP